MPEERLNRMDCYLGDASRAIISVIDSTVQNRTAERWVKKPDWVWICLDTLRAGASLFERKR